MSLTTGSLDSAFQGTWTRRAPSTSFRGDLTPEVFSSQSADHFRRRGPRDEIAGTLSEPEIRTPPAAESSDILSLIVQHDDEPAVGEPGRSRCSRGHSGGWVPRRPAHGARALARPRYSRDRGDRRSRLRACDHRRRAGPRPCRSLQFGRDEYDEATLEYVLFFRILRIRGTFSDAGTLIARSPFWASRACRH